MADAPTIAVAQRAALVIVMLDPRPDQHLLEVGCGGGTAVALVGDRLTTGHITAIDRSPTAAARAIARNAAHITAGRATILQTDLADLDRPDRYHAIFAVNLSLFWAGPAEREWAAIRRHLRPRAPVHLFLHTTSARRTAQVAAAAAAALAAAGFAAETSYAPTPTLAWVRGRLRS